MRRILSHLTKLTETHFDWNLEKHLERMTVLPMEKQRGFVKDWQKVRRMESAMVRAIHSDLNSVRLTD